MNVIKEGAVNDSVAPIQDKIESITGNIKEIEIKLKSVDRWITITTSTMKDFREKAQAYIEQETLNNYIMQEEIVSYVMAPWYKKITKKQREQILLEARERARENFAKDIEKNKKV